MGLVGRASWVFVAITLVGAACSGKSIRHENGSDDDDSDNSSGGSTPMTGGTGSSTGGAVAVGTGGIVSRGGTAGRGGTSPGGASGGGATGGSGGLDCDDDECWIDGACRIDLEAASCPETYAEVAPRSLVDAESCAGRTTEGFFYLERDFAERTCVYDSGGRLVGYKLSDDNDGHCGDHHASGHVAGTFPDGIAVIDMDFVGNCHLPSLPLDFASVSSTWNELFPALPSELVMCGAAADDCRSRAMLYVCRNLFEGMFCSPCADDEECRAEYPYFDPDALTCEGGICRVSAEPLGSCTEGLAAPECRTAAAAYVCDLGTCSVCITGQECELATDGELLVCSGDGACVAE